MKNVNKNRSTKPDKKRQKLTYRTKSARSAQINTKRVFLILTAPTYIAIVYKVVSVEPIIVEAIVPN